VIEVLRAPAFATVQDGGRAGERSAGVPPGGALDPLSLRCGNALLGNAHDDAAIEWALTGGTLRFHSEAHAALTGAEVEAQLDGGTIRHGEVTAVSRGGELRIERVQRGRVVYLCVAGGIAVPPVLGGRGTYLPAGFGGFEGRPLRSGDVLPVGVPSGITRAGARLPPDARVVAPAGAGAARAIAVLPGPQSGVLSPAQWDTLLGRGLTVDARSDRTGFRLSGAGLDRVHRTDGRSEPACVGAVQLTPDGTLIVLMPDGPTVGGYPKIAVVATADLPRLAQLGAGERVSLRLVKQDEALAALRDQEALMHRISARRR